MEQADKIIGVIVPLTRMYMYQSQNSSQLTFQSNHQPKIQDFQNLTYADLYDQLLLDFIQGYLQTKYEAQPSSTG